MAATPKRKFMGTNKENPNWRKDVMAKIAANRESILEKRGIKNPSEALTTTRTQITFVCKREWLDIIHEAALSRGIATSSYARRLLSIAAAKDLGINLRDLLALTPELTPTQWSPGGGLRKSGTRDNGEGIEDWCPHPGCDGSHFTVQ